MDEDDILNGLQSSFSNAAAYVKQIVPSLSKQQILEFYGLYKQATEGPCTKVKPSWYEFTEKQKWDAWSLLKNMDSNKAMQEYISLLNLIDPHWEKKPKNSNKFWVHHSCFENNDEVLEEEKKTVFDWVKEKNLEKVKKYSSNLSDEINQLDDNGLSLLHWATDRGSLEIVKFFIENLKADINIRDNSGQTALHYAVSCEYEDIANYLIQAGADVNIQDNDGLIAYEQK